MRKILFRGQRKDNGVWVYGYVFASCGKSYIIRDDKLPLDWDGRHYEDLGVNIVEVIAETVGQYTGLKDKTGRKIFEGDKVSSGFWSGIVAFVDGAFTIVRVGCSNSSHFDVVEVIGNIHENPEEKP